MSSIKTPAMVPSTPIPRSVPTLAELEEMVSAPDRRVVIRDVDYAFYEQLVDSIPEWRHIHVDFDGKDLEVMGHGRKHERINELLGYLVRVMTEALEIPYKSLGETTWKRREVVRGLEADQCYYFAPEKLAADAAARARKSDDIADYPNPDLAIEVDVSRSKIDRPAIYAALGVAEIWRFEDEDEQVVIERLGDDGLYREVEASGFLSIRAEEVRRWIVQEDSEIEWGWARRLRAWARAEVAPRREDQREEA